MTQFQFDVICNIINSGAPALANELIGALSEQINSSNNRIEELITENGKLKVELARRDAELAESCKCSAECCNGESAEV